MNAESRRILLLTILALLVAAGLSALREASAAGQYKLHLPMVVNIPPPPSPLQNGNFEQGATGWTAGSSNGWDVIVNDLPGSVTPRSGAWAAWLGGAKNETTTLGQQVTVPTGLPVLTYWHWIASADLCGYDQAAVRINGLTVKSYALCGSSDTNGWQRVAINLASYAGQKVTLEFRVTTDDSLNSNLFLDDVTFDDAAALDPVKDVPALLPEPGPKPDFPAEPDTRSLVETPVE